MTTEWILVADAAVARILARPSPAADLQEVEQLADAAAHADEADLRRDAYGRRGGDDLRMGGNATSSAGLDQKHLESIGFARRVAACLHEALQQGRYDALCLACDPRFLGQLRQELSPQVAAVVTEEIDKDLVNEDLRSLTQRFFPG